MALTKTPMQLLLGANGESYRPQGGISDSIWGQRNLDDARFNESVNQIRNMGKPGQGLGFKTSKYGLPNSTWDGFHGLMMGMRDGAEAQGKQLQVNHSQGLGPSLDTRFDGDQIGIKSGKSLTDDIYGGRQDLKTPIFQLRRQFGLR